MWQQITQAFSQIMNDWGSLGGWMIFLLSSLGTLIMIYLGYRLIKWAIGNAIDFVASSEKFFWPLFWTVILSIAFFFLGLFLIWFLPTAGHWVISAFKSGVSMNMDLPAPPDRAGPTPSIQTILSSLPTLAPFNSTSPTGVPQSSPTASAAAPTQGAQSLTGSNQYVVSDNTGATTRSPVGGRCSDTDPKTTTVIPFGTVVTIGGTWQVPYCQGGICTRAMVVAPAQYQGLCVHLSALSAH